jgi:predicted Rossmann fold nucleotide-binding protein DprA/Smf involved in DNA uptake
MALINRNPDATNSELDAKQIVTNKELNPKQRDELIEQYSELVVDSMDMDSLVQYAQEQLANYYDQLSNSELKEQIINTHEEDTYNELIDNVTSDYCEGKFIPNFHD